MPELRHSPLPGQMMRRPLLISSLLRHADRYFGEREIVSYCDDGSLHRRRVPVRSTQPVRRLSCQCSRVCSLFPL